MRLTYIVTYDVCDDKRLRKVFKICKSFGSHLQYSVFECDLTDAEKAELERQLSGEINHNEDQVLFICLGRSEFRGSRVISSLGLPYHRFDDPCYVV